MRSISRDALLPGGWSVLRTFRVLARYNLFELHKPGEERSVS